LRLEDRVGLDVVGEVAGLHPEPVAFDRLLRYRMRLEDRGVGLEELSGELGDGLALGDLRRRDLSGADEELGFGFVDRSR
jgi:hypothetical protein